MKILKKMDVVIIISLMIISFTPQIIFSIAKNKNLSPAYINITVSGRLHSKINLSSIKSQKYIEINTKDFKNTILIKNNTIKMIKANCKDSLCIKQGSISNVGDTLICLPHELVVEIIGSKSDKSSDLILSY